MRLRHLAPALIAPAVIAAATLVPSAAFAADPVGSTNNTEFADASGDAPSAVDMTNVHVYRTAADYRATVSYSALRPQRGNRWFVEFQGLDLPGLPGIPGLKAAKAGTLPTLPLVGGNIVELRLTPGGQLKSLAYKTQDGTTTPATCTGTRAVPSFSRSKITFVIPNNCWRGGPVPLSLVSAGARHYAPGTFDNTELPPSTGDAKSDSLDNPLSVWNVSDLDIPGLPGLPTLPLG